MTRPSTNWLVAFIAFNIANALDGIFTYFIVTKYGIGAEMNPVIYYAMQHFGTGEALVFIKWVAFGISFVAPLWALWIMFAAYTILGVIPGFAILFLGF